MRGGKGGCAVLCYAGAALLCCGGYDVKSGKKLRNYTWPRAVHHSASGVAGFIWWALDRRLGLIPEIEGGDGRGRREQ